MEHSHISWTHHTFNPWRGCTKVSRGCERCYAETMSGRNPRVLGIWGPKGARVIAAPEAWREPLKWNRRAALLGVRERVFCASLADVFEGQDTMPPRCWEPVEAARERLFARIEETPYLDWLLLTKRPENILTMCAAWLDRFGTLPQNVWIGTSVEDQKTAEERIPHLLLVPAAVRFLSCEPLLSAVDLTRFLVRYDGEPPRIHWVIVGGESGKDARPMDPAWVRSLRDQCQQANVAFHFKQTGAALKNIWKCTDRKGGNIMEWPEDLRIRQLPETQAASLAAIGGQAR